MPTHNQIRREQKIRHFKETIELSKVINSCLACYYLGETHMYRPLSAQLRILFCDIQKGKNKALLSKLFDKLKLSPVKTTKYQQQGSFTSNDEWANRSGSLCLNSIFCFLSGFSAVFHTAISIIGSLST